MSTNAIWGLILITIGVLFLLDNYGYVDTWQVMSTYWPVILILFGVKLLFQRSRTKSASAADTADGARLEQSVGTGRVNEPYIMDAIYESNLFGDLELAVQSNDFRGGAVNTIFGDIRLDLTRIALHDGEQTLRLNGVFGDIKVDTPSNIPIRVSGNTLAGDVAIRDYAKSGFGQTITYQSQNYETGEKKLYITVFQIFGDVKIR